MGTHQDSSIEGMFESLIQGLIGSPNPIPWDVDILTLGFVASIHMLEIVMFMEEKFGVVVDPFDIRPEMFQSINTMARFVREKAGPPAAGTPAAGTRADG